MWNPFGKWLGRRVQLQATTSAGNSIPRPILRLEVCLEEAGKLAADAFSRRERILAEVVGHARDLAFYDRRSGGGAHWLSADDLRSAIASGEVSLDEIAELFRRELVEWIGDVASPGERSTCQTT